jgi:hypothetical protein
MSDQSSQVLDDGLQCHDMREEECTHVDGCVWCKSAAVPSACYTDDRARSLPPGIFSCADDSADDVIADLVRLVNDERNQDSASAPLSLEPEDVEQRVNTSIVDSLISDVATDMEADADIERVVNRELELVLHSAGNTTAALRPAISPPVLGEDRPDDTTDDIKEDECRVHLDEGTCLGDLTGCSWCISDQGGLWCQSPPFAGDQEPGYLCSNSSETLSSLAVEFVHGMAIAAGMDSPDVNRVDTDVVLKGLISTVSALLQEDIYAIERALLSLSLVVGEVLRVLPGDQQAQRSTISDLVRVLRFPSGLSYEVGTSLVVDGVEVYPEVNELVHSWARSADGASLGRCVGAILKRLVDLAPDVAPPMQPHAQSPEPVPSQVTGRIRDQLLVHVNDETTSGDEAQKQQNALQVFSEAMEGVLTMAVGGIDTQPLEACVDSDRSVDFVARLSGAVGDLGHDDVLHVLQGFSSLGNILREISDVGHGCGLSDGQISSMKALAAKLVSPSEFDYRSGRKMSIGGVDIRREVSAALADYHRGLWGGFGFKLGTALGKLSHAGVVKSLERPPRATKRSHHHTSILTPH